MMVAGYSDQNPDQSDALRRLAALVSVEMKDKEVSVVSATG